MITAQEVREIQKPIIEEYGLTQWEKLAQVVRDILPIIEEAILDTTIEQSIIIFQPRYEFVYKIGSKRIKHDDLILQGFTLSTIIEAITPHLEENGYIVTGGRTMFNHPMWKVSWAESEQQQGDNNEQTT